MNNELPWEAILQRQSRKWEKICHQVEQFEENPLSLISEIFKGGDLFLAERLKQEGENVLFRAQSYWMSYLLPSLIDYFDEPDVTIFYDENEELSLIYIQYQSEIVARFSPYWHQFETFGVPGKEELLAERQRLISEWKRLEESMDNLEEIAKNPDILAEEDTWGYARAVLRPKKHKAKLSKAVQEASNELFEIQKQVDSIDNQLLFAEQSYVEVSYCLDKIKRKVSRLGDFTFVELQEEELE